MTEQELSDRLESIRQLYDKEIRRMWRITSGGTLRSRKGQLVETIAKNLVCAAWESMGGSPQALEYRKGKHDIPLNKEYLDRLSPEEVLNSVRENRDNMFTSWAATFSAICMNNLRLQWSARHMRKSPC